MALTIPVFLVNLVCAWFQCEIGAKPPYFYITNRNTEIFVNKVTGRNDFETFDNNIDPIAFTKLGPVQGYVVNISDHRQIYSFTGVPYAEPPERFRDPVPKRPWKGVLQGKLPSPFCIQASGVTMGQVRGQEDCLYLDVHTPRLPDRQSNPDAPKQPGLPVFVILPAGANTYGRSLSFGPSLLLREDVILVALNVRFGIFGYLSTGDEASPGNYGLKDQSLAVKWVYENIEAFGGDPRKIIIGGISSGAYTAHLMLFTKHETRNYISGILAISGTSLCNHGLDAVGRVRNSSNIIAESVGCPTSDQGKSKEMVECLRKQDAYILGTKQFTPYKYMPYMSKMLGPTLEPDVPTAFISELPEVQYEKGTVPPIPVIFSRTEDETSLFVQVMRYVFLPVVSRNWKEWEPTSLQLGIRSAKGVEVSYEESQSSLQKVTQFYFNKTTPPVFTNRNDFLRYVDMACDNMYNVPMWKAVELHHKVAPTYVYLNKQRTLTLIPGMDFIQRRLFANQFGSSHASDFILFFNNTRSFPPLSKRRDFETASRNLINMVANFGFYGKPLYRTQTGTLVDVWKPVQDMKRLTVLEVGLVHNISMILDPLQGTGRLEIWDKVKF